MHTILVTLVYFLDQLLFLVEFISFTSAVDIVK